MLKTQNFHSKIGIGGAGQLGTMMILESRGLPLYFNVYSEGANEPGLEIASESFIGVDYERFVDQSDFVTFEFEHINPDMISYASKEGKLRPGVRSIELKMQRHKEKEFLRDNSFPVGKFSVATSSENALREASRFDRYVIKRSSGGYDGKGQYYYNHMEDFPVGEKGFFVVEEFVDYISEASIICGRDSQGKEIFYEPSYNVNIQGILIRNNTGIEDTEIISSMREIGSRLMKSLDYVGIMGIEFFLTQDGPLINEYAPRVHNTGHHTLMGSSISQFENHTRAVTGIPLEDPVTYVPSGIVNIIGTELSKAQTIEIAKIGGTRIFMYRKGEVRKKRKMGHVCVTASNKEELLKKERVIESVLYPEGLENYL
ncbi:ATP-grasp domain-containing protein [Cuniculiplasma sp. SKW4]|uniref:ATP-grasp domain-containing protein n=1 Tax=Cuniculiplasma sp. SKW4 TaxID=3400171 RepID=UPI003FD0EFD2